MSRGHIIFYQKELNVQTKFTLNTNENKSE